ncbi:MAG TPA: hypothetical protein VH300_19140 [Thermoleophilaceae bacterium]|nr:hypothetical protein [Thermoleophilaceae bacterium]
MSSQNRPRRRIARRSLRNVSSVERYLQAGVIPRFIERANQIESGIHRHHKRLERAYEWAQEHHGDNPEGFAAYWRDLAEHWRFDDINELIDEHNRWYPAERRLPLNPRTGDYLTIGNRDWRRRPLDAAWILEQFPVETAA